MSFAKRINLNRLNSSGSIKDGQQSRKGSVFTLDPSLCLPETKEVNTTQRLERLRQEMKKQDLGIYIVPSEDQHQSEYTSAYDQKRSFISGFSGSAGIATITRDLNSVGGDDFTQGSAALSTDGRYFTQALDELDFNWILLKQGAKGEPTWEEWTAQQASQLSLDSGSKVKIGIDPKLWSYKQYQKFKGIVDKQLEKTPKAQIEITPVTDNLVNKIWEEFETLPPSTLGEIKHLDLTFTGKEASDKIKEIRDQVIKDDVDGLVVTGLDEIAWLLNLRGLDIPYNPVFYGFAILTKTQLKLFVGENRLSSNIIENLGKVGVTVEPYEQFYTSLSSLSKEFAVDNKKLFVPNNANWEVVRSLQCSFTEGLSPVELQKSIKNETELKGAQIAHLKDGRALIKFLAWLEHEVVEKGELIDEITADEKLTEFR